MKCEFCKNTNALESVEGDNHWICLPCALEAIKLLRAERARQAAKRIKRVPQDPCPACGGIFYEEFIPNGWQCEACNNEKKQAPETDTLKAWRASSPTDNHGPGAAGDVGKPLTAFNAVADTAPPAEDDSPRLQAMIDADEQVPPGVYHVKSTVYVPIGYKHKIENCAFWGMSGFCGPIFDRPKQAAPPRCSCGAQHTREPHAWHCDLVRKP
jgi:hypothetical protein